MKSPITNHTPVLSGGKPLSAITTQKRRIPLLDLAALHAPLRDEIVAEITRVVDSQKFIMGDEVKDLEKLVAEYSGTQFAVGCASGSDALFLALLAAGIQSGDRVLTTPYTFFATAGAITRAGAVPVFADIDPVTYNIDALAAERVLQTTPGIKAVIPVHLFGACADMDPLLESADRHGCVLVEDGAQSIGAEYKGRRAQSMGQIGCISFFPSKNLGAFGDGGMLTTNDPGLARKLSALRLHGTTKKYYHEWVGVNSRLDTIQAAILKVKFRYLDSWTAGRQRNADLYRELLTAGGLPVRLSMEAEYQTRHVYNQFVINVPGRDELRAALQESGVGTEIYYPLPIHLQPCYQNLGYKEGDFPVSEAAARRTLALPIHSALSEDDIRYICERIIEFCSSLVQEVE
jgi:dTDP-4-amino-4,6-dideoxygalactose transaminase